MRLRAELLGCPAVMEQMNRDAYRRLHRRLADEGLFAVKSGAGVAAFLIAAAWTAAAGVLVLRGHGVERLAWQLLFGIAMFNWFVILHECGHQTFVRSRRLNTAIGCLASVFCFVPYIPWREVHVQHHLWAGVVDRDPTQRSLLRLQRIGRSGTFWYRFWWRFWLPVLFCHFVIETYWMHPLERRRAGDVAGFRRSLASVAVCAAPSLVLMALVGPLQWAIWVVPPWLVFLVIFENVTIPQHAGMTPYLWADHPRPIPYEDQLAVTRSTRLPEFVATFVALNFNHHCEHHLFPKAPWRALPRLRAILVEEMHVHLNEVAFPGFVADLRGRDPIAIYRDSLPGASSPS